MKMKRDGREKYLCKLARHKSDKQPSRKATHMCTREHSEEETEEGTEQENEVEYIEKRQRWGRFFFFPEDVVVRLPPTTKPCPVNFMLSSPQAKRQFASMKGCKNAFSVSNRWRAAENQTRLLFFDMIYCFIQSQNQTAAAGRCRSCP